MSQTLKNYLLPIAMLTGVVLHPWLSRLIFITPGLIFVMLLLTFARMSFKDLQLRGLHVVLLAAQLGGSILAYMLLAPLNPLLAQGVLICVMAPTATSAAVITGMLGGDLAFTASFIFLSNVGVAVAAPLFFASLGGHGDLTFWNSFLAIFRQVMPILLLPLVCVWSAQRLLPRLHGWLVSKTMYSFYLWGVSLSIVMANTVNFMLHQENPDYANEVYLIAGAFVVCALQFFVGKALGGMFHDRISGGQALGQKNTVLAIWMALMFASPLTSIAPASYVLWQNLFNSWQLWRKQRGAGAAPKV